MNLTRIFWSYLHIRHQKRRLHVDSTMKAEYLNETINNYAQEGSLFWHVIVVKEAAYRPGFLIEKRWQYWLIMWRVGLGYNSSNGKIIFTFQVKNLPIISNAPLKYSSSSLGGIKGLFDNSMADGLSDGSCCRSHEITWTFFSNYTLSKEAHKYFVSGERAWYPRSLERWYLASSSLQLRVSSQIQC